MKKKKEKEKRKKYQAIWTAKFKDFVLRAISVSAREIANCF
jgi:hypothetical protein